MVIMFLNYIKNEINNESILFLLYSNIYFEKLLIDNFKNLIKINKYEIDKDDYLLKKIFNTYSFNSKKKIIMVTDTNLLNINIIKKIIGMNNKNVKLIFCINRKLDKIIKKINKKNIKIQSLKDFENKNIKYNKYKINDYSYESKSIELYDSCNNILLSDCKDINELYNIFLMEKVYIPLTIHNNYYKYTNNDEIINEYLDLFCYSEQIQDTIFKDGYKELLYIYFIITCIIPSKMLKNNLKNNISKNGLKFSNIISYMSILIRKKNNFYNNLRKTKLHSLDENYLKDEIIKISKNKKLMNKYKLDNNILLFFKKYFNIY